MTAAAPDRVGVAIIGAGASGLIAALALKASGRHDFSLFERGAALGGVWRDNVYPGCACDIPANLYSLAARPNPGWTSNFAHQPEILAYLEDVAARDGLSGHIRFGWEVRRLRFDPATAEWVLSSTDGRETRARAVIVATGPQNRPVIPAIPGLDGFKGSWSHSSAWDAEVPLHGRRVAVIGTGASAVQIVPALAPLVAALTVFQRSAAWVLPRGERPTTRFKRRLFARFPMLQALDRRCVYLVMELAGRGNLGSRAIIGLLTRIATSKLAAEVPDARLRAALTPDYPIGCKRIAVSDAYLPAFSIPGVHLETSAIREIAPDAIVTADGRRFEVDHIVFATGFRVADADGYLEIEGTSAHRIPDDWLAHGAQAYLGTVASGFPNLAFLLGPNSGLSHSSALHVVESQMRYLLQWLQAIGSGGALDVKKPVQDHYNAGLQAKLVGTTWAAGCRSWFLDREGRNTTIYPGLTADFRRRLARFRESDFVRVSPASGPMRDEYPSGS